MQMSAEATQITTSTNGRKRGKLKLLSRDNLDHRCLSSKRFDSIAAGIAEDLGGEDRLSTVQRWLIEVFAGASVRANDLIARTLLGQEIDDSKLNQYASTMVRVASRIGVHRAPRQVPTLSEYLAALKQQPIDADEAQTPIVDADEVVS